MQYRFVFLADPQLGCHADLSGAGPERIAAFAARGMRVRPTPKVEGFDWEVGQLSKAATAINHLRPTFVVVGGDLVHDIDDDGQIEAFLVAMDAVDDDIPVHWLPGNHDVASADGVPDAASLARYRQVFGPDRFAFEVGWARFVALNTSLLGQPASVPTEAADQMAFLVEQLEEARTAGLRVVLLGHHPLFVERPDEPDSYWNIPLAHRRPVLDLVHRHGVRTGFAGHLHRNAHGRDGAFEMVTAAAVGCPLGDDPSGYLLVDVGEDVTHSFHPLDSGDHA